jgi:outer membrane protein assembly factor BamB
MESAVVRYLILGAALVSACAGVGLAACASDAPADTASDASSDAPLLGDTTPPIPDAAVPLGDVCGDPGGLEKDAPWPMRGGCPKRAGVSSVRGPQGGGVRWSAPLPAGESSPVVAGDRRIWIGTADGDVVVVSANGVVQGALRTGGPVRSSPARSASGLAIVGSTDGTLYGVVGGEEIFDAGSGGGGDAGLDGGDEAGAEAGADAGVPSAFLPMRAIFAHPLAPIASSPVIGGDGTIYVATSDGKLVALSADGASVKWTATTNDTQGASPALAADGTVVIGSSDGHLYAFNPDGSPRWSLQVGGALGSPVIGGGDTVYVGSSDGTLSAVTASGKRLFSYATGGPIAGAPCVRGGVVYVGSDDKKLHALDAISGAARWTYATLGAVATPVVGHDGVVYVGSADGNVYALAPSGLLYFAVKAKGRIRSAPAIGSDGTLYVATDTALVAIGP